MGIGVRDSAEIGCAGRPISSAGLAAAFEKRVSDAALTTLARAAIDTVSGAIPQPMKSPDARISRALELMRDRLSDSIALGAMAAAVHLSPDRFRHLFMKRLDYWVTGFGTGGTLKGVARVLKELHSVRPAITPTLANTVRSVTTLAEQEQGVTEAEQAPSSR
jgi:hypothetical protein